jgi:hypothetical protein
MQSERVGPARPHISMSALIPAYPEVDGRATRPRPLSLRGPGRKPVGRSCVVVVTSSQAWRGVRLLPRRVGGGSSVGSGRTSRQSSVAVEPEDVQEVRRTSDLEIEEGYRKTG